jgi:hypothetical protein
MTKRKPPARPATAWPGATLWKLDAVTPYPHNARTHPPAQIDVLAGILLKYGPDQPIVVDEDGVILKGHGRRLAAYKAAEPEFAARHNLPPAPKTFPVVQRLGLPDDDKRAMRISDNQSGLLSGWDGELMKFEIESLKRNGYDVALLGFGEQQLVQFTTTPGPPAGFATFDESIPVQHECPKCHYVWSGNSAPRPEPEAKAKPNGKKK